MASALRPSFQPSKYASPMSSTVASRGMLNVLEIAPERNGWAAAIIRTWPRQAMLRPPLRRREGTVEDRQVLVLQAGRAFDRVVLVDVVEDRPGSSGSS